MIKSILTRLNNKGTILALAALVLSLLVQFGFNIDSERVMGIMQTICSILILLGILNDPTSDTEMFIPYVNDKFMKTEDEIDCELQTFKDDDDYYQI